jgi:hypothetical protein
VDEYSLLQLFFQKKRLCGAKNEKRLHICIASSNFYHFPHDSAMFIFVLYAVCTELKISPPGRRAHLALSRQGMLYCMYKFSAARMPWPRVFLEAAACPFW